MTGEVAIVGAGYSGLVLAWKLAEAGVKVDVYEEHGKEMIGMPRHCTGLVSERVVDGLQARDIVLDSYRAVEFFSHGEGVKIRPRGGIYRLDRVKLERELYRRASSAGASFLFQARVEEVGGDGIIRWSGGSRRYEAIVVATGSLGRIQGVRVELPPRRLTGWNMLYTSGQAPPEDTIRVDFSRNLSSGFFAWIMRARHGILAGSASKPEDARAVRERLESAYNLSGRIDSYGGVVLAGPPVRPLVQGRLVLVGDAGGLVKPLTGGGLYPGLLVAEVAASMVNRGVNPGVAVAKAVKTVASRLWRQYRVARLLHSSPELVAEGIRYVRETGVAERLSGVIDYDMHEKAGVLLASKLGLRGVLKLVSRPRLIVAGLRILASGIV